MDVEEYGIANPSILYYNLLKRDLVWGDFMFIGREKELDKLNRLYHTDDFQCAIIYGRRRVGKTTLINEFCRDKRAVYFVAIESTIKNNMTNLSRSIFAMTMPGLETTPTFETLDQAFDYLYALAKEERIVLVIDEYPYLANADKSTSSVLQMYIDQKLKNSKLYLILCGSSMSFMENQVLGYQSPLYGRRTAQFKIKPFDYYTSALFYPDYSFADKALAYGVTGGVPQYLEKINPKLSLKENIIYNFLDDNGYFFEEPSNLLKQELREPQIYNAIITAIANGASKLNEISTGVGLETSVCSTYIKSLISLGLLEKEKPIGEENAKKSIYKITDHMFKFWYRFVPNNISAITSGNGVEVYDRIVEPHLNEYMGKVFEDMAVQYLLRLNLKKELPFVFFNIGRWWGTNAATKEQVEIDIIATFNEENQAIFAECKYKNSLVDIDVLHKLVDRAELIKKYQEKYYYLFSKSGYTNRLQSSNNKATLISLSDMYAPLV